MNSQVSFSWRSLVPVVSAGSVLVFSGVGRVLDVVLGWVIGVDESGWGFNDESFTGAVESFVDGLGSKTGVFGSVVLGVGSVAGGKGKDSVSFEDSFIEV